MKVEFIRVRKVNAAGPNGPFTRVFSIGEVVELPDLDAQIALAAGEAVIARAKAAAKEAQEAAPEPVTEAPKAPSKAAAKKAR